MSCQSSFKTKGVSKVGWAMPAQPNNDVMFDEGLRASAPTYKFIDIGQTLIE